MVQVTLDIVQNCRSPLTEERLLAWYAALFPTGRSGLDPIVPGAVGGERIHFEGPVPEQVPGEMDAFLRWLESPPAEGHTLRADVAHLKFVTIHPFGDGNVRIARAITDMHLARSGGTRRRFYSMTAQIHRERNSCYRVLEQTQKDGTDITCWMSWFMGCLERAIHSADASLDVILTKARFWQSIAGIPINT